MGTIGGNIANASPIDDLPPILMALDAKIHLRQLTGHLTDSLEDQDKNEVTPYPNPKTTHSDEIIALAEFFTGYKTTQLKSGSYWVVPYTLMTLPNPAIRYIW